MVEPGNARLPVSRQCELLGMSRSGYYYRPQPASKEDLLVMRLIDEKYTRHPFYGTGELLAEFLVTWASDGNPYRRFIGSINRETVPQIPPPARSQLPLR